MSKPLSHSLFTFVFCSFVLGTLSLCTFTGCANRGIGPQGGPKDSIPPVPLKSDPEIGALNFHGKRIEVTFDEYIELNDVVSNMLMSPPQQKAPDVKARGKRLIVQFQDSLRDSTTYTIDFGDAVCDFRERVPLHGYSFYFSTGDEIDTLDTRGKVYNAENLNPCKGLIVGIHRDMADSAFTSSPFLRIAKTDSAGFFRIGNIHPGMYRLYAVDDVSRDYRLTIGESLAFADDPIHVQPRDTADTTAAPQTALFLFKEEQKKLYLQRTQRDQQHRVLVSFSASPDSLPVVRPLYEDSLNYHIHFSAKGDTMTIWLTDSMSIWRDSLFFEARYRRTDSLYRLEWTTDTLRAIWRAPRLSAKAKETQEKQRQSRRLELTTNARKGFEIFDTIRLQCTTPLASIERDSIHLFERIDTVLHPIPFTILPYDTLPMSIVFAAELKPQGAYVLQLDSGALHDIYGVTHIAANYGLQVKNISDYSTIRVKITPFDARARIQLLNAKDVVVRELPAAEDGAFFEYLKPDTYYLRLYIDANGDGKWTTGSWDEKRQPELVYYFPQNVQTKSNWDFEEEWNYTLIPQTKAKPKELIKASANAKKK